jgi:hypothetical protein
MDITNEKKEDTKTVFQYKLKLRTAIIGFVLYLLLSTETSFKILHLLLNASLSFSYFLKEQNNEITFLDKFIMAFIIAIILFIF